MADGTGKSDTYSQLLIKAGLPLAVAALAALFCVKKASSVQILDENDHLNSTDKEIDTVNESQDEVVSGLVNRINEVRVKQDELETRVERFQSMKENELMILELKNILELEIMKGEYMEKEVSFIESEIRRIQELEIYGMDLYHQVENLKLENVKLKRNLNKCFRKFKEGIRVNKARKSMIRILESMIKRSHDEVKKGIHVVNQMGDEIYELQTFVDELRSEKMELLKKLEVAEDSLTLKYENEIIRMKEFNQIKNELENLQNEFSSEGVELVKLRWANAFLRRQLIQKDDLLEDVAAAGKDGVKTYQTLVEKDLHYELEKIASEGECSTSSPEIMTGDEFLKKNPVEESDLKMGVLKADEGDVKSYGRHFSWDWVEEHVHGYGR